MGFDNDKKVFLGKKDKSRKQCIDKKIEKLVNKINSLENYYTTSSCSGRVILIKIPKINKKHLYEWLISVHGKAKLSQLKTALKNNVKGDIWFKAQSLILHVCCRTIEDAGKLIGIARNTGCKRSGITALKNKIIVEVVGSESIEAPIVVDSSLIAEDDYIKTLVKEGNKKLESAWSKIGKLEKEIRRLT